MSIVSEMERTGFGRDRVLMRVMYELERNAGELTGYSGTTYDNACAAMDAYERAADEKDAKAAQLEAEAYQLDPPDAALLASAGQARMEAVNIRALVPQARGLLDSHALGAEYHDDISDANETAFRF